MTVTTAAYNAVVSGSLRRSYGGLRNAAQEIARRTGNSPRTVENWLDGTSSPRGAELIKLMAECEELETEILRLVRSARSP